MLNSRSSDFAELVWRAVEEVGRVAPAVANKIIRSAFPRTVAEAEIEGADKMLRVGVIEAVKNILKHTDADDAIDFATIDPSFGRIIKKLKSKTYLVESLGEYVPIKRLIGDHELLDDARKHMRRKGEENLAEAKILDELYEAITVPSSPSPSTAPVSGSTEKETAAS